MKLKTFLCLLTAFSLAGAVGKIIHNEIREEQTRSEKTRIEQMKEPENQKKYFVNPGDTLWEIATPEASQYNMDIREVIYDIGRINSLDGSTIYPNQELKLPRYENLGR